MFSKEEIEKLVEDTNKISGITDAIQEVRNEMEDLKNGAVSVDDLLVKHGYCTHTKTLENGIVLTTVVDGRCKICGKEFCLNAITQELE